MKKTNLTMFFLILLGLFSISGLVTSPSIHQIENSLLNLKTSGLDYGNATVISDGYGGVWGWNTAASYFPELAMDNAGNIHVVWQDDTDYSGKWGNDREIMYVKYTTGSGWGNATVISDGYGGIWGWNDGSSMKPDIAVDKSNNVHVVWDDTTSYSAKWGTDKEIMYVKYTDGVGWSNVTILSDGYGGVWGWNDLSSDDARIVVDNSNNLHVVWTDQTDYVGKWGIDDEIMYVKYTDGVGWSNVTVISDGYGGVWGWNDGVSQEVTIAVDLLYNVHVAWRDLTAYPSKWGTDWEIMYVKYTTGSGWGNATVISDGYGGVWGWNDGSCNLPAISADKSGNVHVIWEDSTDYVGKWGIDDEIMYVKYTVGVGWSNVTILSDGYGGVWGWNDDDSGYSDICTSGANNVHVVWEEYSDGIWGGDTELAYVNYTEGKGWTNVSMISDGYGGVWGWNDGSSGDGDIFFDDAGKIHAVWTDSTSYPGKWGTDQEIMYTVLNVGLPPEDNGDKDNGDEPPGPMIPFGSYYLLFLAIGIIYIIIAKKRKIIN